MLIEDVALTFLRGRVNVQEVFISLSLISPGEWSNLVACEGGKLRV